MIDIKDWKKQQVKDICDLGRGRVINAQNIELNPGVYPVFSSQSQNKGEMGKIDTYDFDGEYVTWTTDGAYAGTVFHRIGKFNCTNVCGTLKAKSSQLSMSFLAYKLSTLAKDYVSYVGNPKLMNNVMANIELSLPETETEQTQIATILSTIDQAIAQTEAIIAKQQRIKTGLMQDLLTKGIDEAGNVRSEETHEFKDSAIGRIPLEWEVINLGELSNISSGITLGKSYVGIHTLELPYLRVANVQDGYLDLSEVKNIRLPRVDASRYKLQKGDVLMNEGGDFDKLGRGTVWNGEIEDCLHQNHVFKVRVDSKKMLSNYLATISSSTYGKKFFVLSSKQSTNLASINSTQLKLFPIPLPSLAEQQRIQNTIKGHLDEEANLLRQERKLKSIKTGLMQDLLTGKVRVTDFLEAPP